MSWLYDFESPSPVGIFAMGFTHALRGARIYYNALKQQAIEKDDGLDGSLYSVG
jgi:hypothetical protein